MKIIAPAANPSPYGSALENRSTNRNAGTAMIGCGMMIVWFRSL